MPHVGGPRAPQNKFSWRQLHMLAVCSRKVEGCPQRRRALTIVLQYMSSEYTQNLSRDYEGI